MQPDLNNAACSSPPREAYAMVWRRFFPDTIAYPRGRPAASQKLSRGSRLLQLAEETGARSASLPLARVERFR